MALKYASQAVVEVDGQEIELTKLDVKVTTGRKPVKVISRKGKVKGFAKGITEYELSVTVAVPLDGSEPDWDEVEDARITVEEQNGVRTSYLNCFSTSIGTHYTVDNEELRDLVFVACDKVVES